MITTIGFIQIATVVVALAACNKPLGAYMARVYTTDKDLRVESLIYRIIGVDPRAQQPWRIYLRGVLAFSIISILALYLLQRVQHLLPFAHGIGPVTPDQAWNTAVSFTTNTNWQSYSGETAMTQLPQLLGQNLQNFVSASVGMAVAIALVRAIAAKHGRDEIGSFWVDLVRGCIRILLPIAFISAIILMASGAIQNFHAPTTFATLSGGTQTIPGGGVASQEVIKELGTNGGGYFNANSAHPYENPTGITNLLEIFLILLIPTALTRTYGIMVGSAKHGWALLGAMATIFTISLATTVWSEMANVDSAISQGGAAMEGREARLGVIPSAFFATATTLTSTGAVDSFHSSYSSFGGGILILNMLLGEIAPGGVGAGLYGMLIVALLAVFISGLMVGRSPEYLGKKIGVAEIKYVSLYTLVVPFAVLVAVGASILLPTVHESMLNTGPHGLSEVLYAFTSGANNNGSAFAGFNANTLYLNTTIAIAMLFGRFIPIVLVLALAGKLAKQQPVPVTSGTLPTHKPLFVGVTVGTAYLVTGLTFLPVLALGPLAEGLS